MRIDAQVTERLRDMLTKDKLGLSDGFLTSFKADFWGLVCDYFEVEGKPSVLVKEREDGKIELTISATATKLKTFDTTMKHSD